MKAYFTVEAACILPMILGVFAFVIYAMLFQYDRCLLEQDAFLLLLGRRVEEHCDYPAMELDYFELKEGNGSVYVNVGGNLKVPFQNVIGNDRERSWRVELSSQYPEIDPTKWIRLCKEVLEETENAAD